LNYIIRIGPEHLPLYWGVDGWQAHTYWAIKYPSKEAATKAIKLIDVRPGQTVYVEEHMA
jgi:hypothetical protein